MGELLLVTAMLAAALIVIMGVVQRRRHLRRLATVLAIALVAATVRLVWAIATLDFSFVYVANQARARSSNGYRFAALWAGAEGSLLYFTALLSLVVAWMMWRGRLGPWGVAVSAAAVGGLAATVLMFANPFERASLPAIRGAGLTPILEHPAMLYHPTILYLGLVTTLVPFAPVFDRDRLALDDKVSLARLRQSLIIPWTLLTIGLATGANWAYVELGWGGYWAWDPVENTVLIPWLVLTAAIHFIRSPGLCGRFPRSAVALVALPFPLAMFGTAVTRSGGLSSVHAFAERDALGWSLGALVILLAAMTGARVIRESPKEDTGGGRLARMGLLQLLIAASAIAAVVMAAAVLMGVGVPLLPGSNRVVTAAFYNRIGAPLLVVALLVMTLVSTTESGAANSRARRTRLAGSAVTFVAALMFGLALGARQPFVFLVVALGVTVAVGHLSAFRRLPVATVVGHVGFVVLALGIAGSAQATTETVVLAPGEVEQFGSGYQIEYESFVVSDGPRPRSEVVTARTTVTTGDDSQSSIVLEPGLVSYPEQGVILAETSLHSSPWRDIQVVLRTITDDGLAAFELSERPALMLVWWGSTLIAFGGAVSLVTSRRRS